MAYDNAVYGMKFRKWFSRDITQGGDAAAGFTLGSGAATHVASWYPDVPIKITKFGLRCDDALGTSAFANTQVAATAGAFWPFHLGRQGFVSEKATVGAALRIASLHMPAPYTKGSLCSQPTMSSRTLAVIQAGSLVCIKAGTLRYASNRIVTSTGNSTAAIVSFFVDYSPQYGAGSDAFWTE